MAASRSLRQWWTRTNDLQLLSAQENLLASLVRAPMVSSKQKYGLNTVEFQARDDDAAKAGLPTVVLLHGFGSGLGFFFRNIDPLLESGTVGRVLLVDWLGMGGSERPPCRRPIRGLSDCTTAWCQSRFSPPQVVDFFLDPLHQLMKDEVASEKRKGGGPFWMVGHSLGGYLTARYALRYATGGSEEKLMNASANAKSSTSDSIDLEKVVLASPVGFPAKPTNLLPSAQLPTAIRLVDALWSANVTPQQLVRMMGATRGRNAVRRALAGRIPHLQASSSSSDDGSNVLDLLADYLFHITVAHPSGEFAMNSLLEPGMSPDMAGVFAREPLEPLFEAYGNQHQHPNRSSLPTTKWKVVFGDKDWMRPNEPSARQALANIPLGSVSVVPNAGHHLYLDNPDDFVHHILN